MARFGLYSPGDDLPALEALSHSLKIYGVELGEGQAAFGAQELRRAHFESGLEYVCLNLEKEIGAYHHDHLCRLAMFCEANDVGAIVFRQPGDDIAKACEALDTLAVFRLNVVFENRNDSFLAGVGELDAFFRKNRAALLCYNAAEFAKKRVHPFLSALNGQTFRRQLFMVRVHDRRFDGSDVLPIDGDAELCEVFSAAAGFGRNVWASVAAYGGFSHAEIRKHMADALLRI